MAAVQMILNVKRAHTRLHRGVDVRYGADHVTAARADAAVPRAAGSGAHFARRSRVTQFTIGVPWEASSATEEMR